MISFKDMPTIYQLVFLAGILAFCRMALLAYRRIHILTIRKNIRDIVDQLAILYKLENPFKVSADYRKENNIDKDEYIYGEIMFASFTEILSHVDPQPYENYYDLGCGSGKSVFLAALLYDKIIAHGVEILPPMHDLDIKLLNNLKAQLKSHPKYKTNPLNIHFYNDDIFEFDFSNADIIFINATCYSKKSWEKLEEKFKTLKKGTRLIVNTKKLHDNCFKTLHGRLYLMSWGASYVRIYLKTK